MPLTKKGQHILSSMRKTYSSEKKAKSVFYASINAGKITGAEKSRARGGPVDAHEQREKELIGELARMQEHRAEGGPVAMRSNVRAKMLQDMASAQDISESVPRPRGSKGDLLPGAGRADYVIRNMEERAGMRARGGHAGHAPYIVGERGPELFVPDRPGTVIPHHELTRLARKYGGRVSQMRKRQEGGEVHPLEDTQGMHLELASIYRDRARQTTNPQIAEGFRRMAEERMRKALRIK